MRRRFVVEAKMVIERSENLVIDGWSLRCMWYFVWSNDDTVVVDLRYAF